MTTDMSQFLQTFYEESFEGLEVMEAGLLDLDVGAADAELVNSIFRAAHSIKGGSATFGLGEVAAFTHYMETILDELRDGRRQVSQAVVDLLLESGDCLKAMLVANRAGEELDLERAQQLQQRMEALIKGGQAEAAPATGGATAAAAGSGWRIHFKPLPHLFKTGNDPVRIFRELDGLGELHSRVDLSSLPAFPDLEPEDSFLAWELELRGEAERAAVDEAFAWVDGDCELSIEALPAEAGAGAPAAAQPAVEVAGELIRERRKREERRKGDRRGGAAVDSGSIRVNIDKVDSVINLVGELVITQSMLSTLGENFDMAKLARLRGGLVQLERNTRELQESVMSMRLLPISFVFNRFPRMVHDLSGQLGKQVELKMSGEGTEVDKTVIEKITDPLVHLVRNAMDHGVEPPEARRAAGKPESGTVWLNAFHKGGNIVIEVRDDGHGLDKDRLFAKGVERGLVAADAQLDEEQIFELLFQPGFSTAEKVSDVSGRGVGMDVVRRNIQSVGGRVEVSSELGKGSLFTVRLPLTLAILDGLTVAVGDEAYIVPLVSIIESMQVTAGMINNVAGSGETFRVRDEFLPVIRLYQIFGVAPRTTELAKGLLVVVESEGRRVGLFVDDLLGQQQVVIKSLEANYRRVEGISGATILGDGMVALILDVPGLIRLSRN